MKSNRNRRSAINAVRPFLWRRAASPTVDLLPIIVLARRGRHPPLGSFTPLRARSSSLRLKGMRSAADLIGPGGPSRGEEPATGRPAFARYFRRRRYRSWATTCSRGSPDGSLPPSREPHVGDAMRPAETAGRVLPGDARKSTDGPHWGGRDRPSPCFGAPPALDRGLRHPAIRAWRCAICLVGTWDLPLKGGRRNSFAPASEGGLPGQDRLGQ